MLTRSERKQAQEKREVIKQEKKRSQNLERKERLSRERKCFVENGYHNYQPNYNTIGDVLMCKNCNRYYDFIKCLFEPQDPSKKGE